MTTGLHVVVDIFCVGCSKPVGWRYVSFFCVSLWLLSLSAHIREFPSVCVSLWLLSLLAHIREFPSVCVSLWLLYVFVSTRARHSSMLG